MYTSLVVCASENSIEPLHNSSTFYKNYYIFSVQMSVEYFKHQSISKQNKGFPCLLNHTFCLNNGIFYIQLNVRQVNL